MIAPARVRKAEVMTTHIWPHNTTQHTRGANARLGIRAVNPVQWTVFHLVQAASGHQTVHTHPRLGHTKHQSPRHVEVNNIPLPSDLTLASASSDAMNTVWTSMFKSGLRMANARNKQVINATCPRQSVVPRPYSLSPSMINLKGGRSQTVGSAGTTAHKRHVLA
jgi:hypothetical protein